jgi:hypothetical protein
MLNYVHVDVVYTNCMRVDTCYDGPNYLVCDSIEEYVRYEQHRSNIAQQVSETILSLRSHWVQQHLSELQKRSVVEVNTSILEEVMDYLMLNKVLSKRLNRVLTV